MPKGSAHEAHSRHICTSYVPSINMTPRRESPEGCISPGDYTVKPAAIGCSGTTIEWGEVGSAAAVRCMWSWPEIAANTTGMLYVVGEGLHTRWSERALHSAVYIPSFACDRNSIGRCSDNGGVVQLAVLLRMFAGGGTVSTCTRRSRERGKCAHPPVLSLSRVPQVQPGGPLLV